jgi:hypothetical protein
VAGSVLSGVLPFAVLEISRFHDDPCTVAAGPLAMRSDVVHTHHDGVSHLTGARRMPVPAYVGDDDSTVTEPELCSVVVTDPDPLDEPECR